MKLRAAAIPLPVRRWTGAVALVCSALWAYAPCLRGDWLWDDGLEVAANPVLRDPAGWWKAWVSPVGLDYYPLKTSVQWLEWHIWADRTLGYHAVNFALHMLAALLVWRLLTRLGVSGAWFGGWLFALHPLAVESVAWISEFKSVLALPLLLLAALAFLRFDETASRSAYWAAVGCFAASLLAKTSGVMFPAILLLYVWWRHQRLTWRELGWTVPFFAFSAVLGMVTLRFQAHRGMELGGQIPAFKLRFMQSGWNLAEYFVSSVWPFQWASIYSGSSHLALWPVPWLIAVGLALLFWSRRTSWGQPALLGLGWWFLSLLPVLGFVAMAYLRVAPRADHLAYVALVGVVGLVASGVGIAFRRFPVLAGAVAAVLLGACAWAVRARSAAYRDPDAFWTEAVRRNPQAWLARNNLGRADLQEHRNQAALEQLTAAVQLQPDSAEAHANLGLALERVGRPSDARAEYEAAIQANPGFAGAHYDLGLYWLRVGRSDLAETQLRLAIRSDPDYAVAHNNLGLALARLGRPQEGAAEYRAALRADPLLPEAHVNLGNLLLNAGDPAGAAAEYRRALRIDPRYLAAHRNLSSALRALGQFQEAQIEFEASTPMPEARVSP